MLKLIVLEVSDMYKLSMHSSAGQVLRPFPHPSTKLHVKCVTWTLEVLFSEVHTDMVARSAQIPCTLAYAATRVGPDIATFAICKLMHCLLL